MRWEPFTHFEVAMELTLTAAPRDNRRQHPRWVMPPGWASLGVRRHGSREFLLHGPVRDISWCGMRFELDQPLDAGEEVEVDVELAGGHTHVLQAKGRVVRL